MKKYIVLLALAWPCFSAWANEDSQKAATRAEKSLQSANGALKVALLAQRANALPESRTAIASEQAVWREQVKANCAPDEEGSKSGTGAELEYAQSVQCEADAARIRAKKLSAIGLLR